VDTVRAACIAALGERTPVSAWDVLLRRLAEDPAWQVRVEAARALGATHDPAVVAALEAALADSNEYVRAAVAHALGRSEPLAVGSPAAPAAP
jgi:HEAT repeat protein